MTIPTPWPRLAGEGIQPGVTRVIVDDRLPPPPPSWRFFFFFFNAPYAYAWGDATAMANTVEGREANQARPFPLSGMKQLFLTRTRT
jgi:hypothetical protein